MTRARMTPARVLRALLAGLLMLGAGCAQDEVRVGSKAFTENRIVSEMLLALLEDAGIPAVRVAPLGERGAAFASLRAGTLDVYPDYVASIAGRIGTPQSTDRDQVADLVRAELAGLGIAALGPIGFDDGYVVVTSRDVARAEALRTIPDLAGIDRPLRIGVSDGFARRPDGGLAEAVDALGLQDAEVIVAPTLERATLYDDLIDGRLDVVVGFRTDPQISDYGLVLLGPREGTGPDYDAIALVRQAVVEARPEAAAALRPLMGRIDTDTMRELTARVDLDGVPPRTVARDALSRMGLIAGPPRVRTPPFRIAMEPPEIGEVPAIRAMRAARRAMPGRDIDPVPSDLLVDAVREGRARAALAPATALFDRGPDGPELRPGVVSLAAVSRSVAHLLAPAGSGDAMPEGLRLATGPVGSASHRLARLAEPWALPGGEIVPLAASDAATAAQALRDGRADRALVLASLGRNDIETLLAEGRERLADWSGWFEGSANLALTMLRDVVIGDGIYGPDQPRVATLSMQMVMIGPAADARQLGRAGPSVYADPVQPLPDATVLALGRHLGPTVDVAPQLAPAPVLSPKPLPAAAPLNPAPAQTVLSLGIVVFLLWAVWLFFRPMADR